MKKTLKIVCLTICCFLFLSACSSDRRNEFIETSNQVTESFNAKIQDSQDKEEFDEKIAEATELIDKLEAIKVPEEYQELAKQIVLKDREIIKSIKELYSFRSASKVKEYNAEIKKCNKLLNELNKLQEEFLK